MSEQLKQWSGEFGRKYTKRNPANIQDMENSYKKKYGITRENMNTEFLFNLEKDMNILEVGCNIGNQIALLKDMGFTNLYGIEISDYALEIAKKRSETKEIHFIKGTAFDIPCKEGCFDLVFTSGVLIHIPPDNIDKAISEIYRCSKKYIWGLEYYAESYQEIIYRGHKDLMWKTDFTKIYRNNFPDLKLMKEKRFIYLEKKNLEDQMFLLEKQSK